MKILISNDDGIMADGLRALTNILSKDNEVYVVVPNRERSAAGHSLTLQDPIRVDELDSRYGAKRIWTTSGTPGDCVKIALTSILSEEEKPDLVISGINHGPNLGLDILYSGTVSCALEGAILGYKSIAVSLATMSMSLDYFYTCAKIINKFIPKVKEFDLPKKSILNINIPGVNEEKIQGAAITTLGSRMFTDAYERRVDPRGKVYYWMAGDLIAYNENDETDINAVRWNKVSITPICFDSMTNMKIIPDLENVFCKDGKCDWI